MDPNNRLKDLIKITARLIELLKRENNALRNHKTEVVHSLLDEKATLARLYESRFKGWAEKPGVLEGTDKNLNKQLGALAKEVDGLIQENGELLHIAIEANRRVVDLIAEAVHAQQPTAGTYSSKAQTSNSGANAASQRVALSLDQTL